MIMSKGYMESESVKIYLKDNPPTYPLNRAEIANGVLGVTRDMIGAQNALLQKGQKIHVPDSLSNSQIAMLIEKLEPVKRIVGSNTESTGKYDLLGMFQVCGILAGIYDTRDCTIDNLIQEYKFDIGSHDIKEIKEQLRRKLPREYRCMERDLIAVNNGIFDYKTKQLLKFDPNKIFLSKSRVDYNPNAQNITIHNPDDNTKWDVESWMNELSNDPEIVNLLWEILGAIIRPNVKWDKSAWLYATDGNNGKGTLCTLMRNLCGEGSYASIALSDFSKDFIHHHHLSFQNGPETAAVAVALWKCGKPRSGFPYFHGGSNFCYRLQAPEKLFASRTRNAFTA